MKRIADFLPGSELYPLVGDEPQGPNMVALTRKTHQLLCPTLTLRESVGVILGGQAVVGPGFFPSARPCSGDNLLDGYFVRNVTRDDQVLTVIDVSRTSHGEVLEALSKARRAAFGEAQFRNLVGRPTACTECEAVGLGSRGRQPSDGTPKITEQSVS
jgi:hypothetical protein